MNACTGPCTARPTRSQGQAQVAVGEVGILLAAPDSANPCLMTWRG